MLLAEAGRIIAPEFESQWARERVLPAVARQLEDFKDPKCKKCDGLGFVYHEVDDRGGDWRGVIISKCNLSRLSYGDIVGVNRFDGKNVNWFFDPFRLFGIDRSEPLAFGMAGEGGAIAWTSKVECAILSTTEDQIRGRLGNYFLPSTKESAA